jgi:DNA-binding transcriptional MerR regulator
MYNMKSVATMLGISAGTIRSWENRYNVVSPQRSEGGHRLYTDEDVEDLHWLKVQTEEKGLSISQAAIMLRKKKQSLTSQQGANRVEGIPLNYLAMSNHLYDALIEVDVEKANTLVDLGFSMYQFEEMLHQVFLPLLIRVGDEWENGIISVAQEHLASQFVLQRCMQFFRIFPIDHSLSKILAACPEDEHHQVGLLLFSLFLRRKGHDVIFLGANTPVSGISQMINFKKSDYLCLSLSNSKRINEMITYIDTVLGQAPQVKLVLGGRGFEALPSEHPYRSNVIGDNLESWERWYRKL